jgi:hypothetical protein
MKSGFFFFFLWGILPLSVTSKNRASSCTQDFLREKNRTKSYYILREIKVEIVIFRSYVVAYMSGFQKK